MRLGEIMQALSFTLAILAVATYTFHIGLTL